MKTRVGSGLVVALMLFYLPAFAQIIPGADSTPSATFIPDRNTYGTQSETAYTIFNQDFSVGFSGITWGWLNYRRYVTSNYGCCLFAGVRLPAGASITAIELEGCDASTTGALTGYLFSCPVPDGTPTSPGYVTTGTTAAPGCGLSRANLSSPVTVDNGANTYFFQVDNQGDVTGAVSLRAVRVYYKLQVSPAPGTATFADVPTTHLFFQYVEALAAAGITSGCGGGNFCPDAAVTRGQMAVFLAKALGLHWTP